MGHTSARCQERLDDEENHRNEEKRLENGKEQGCVENDKDNPREHDRQNRTVLDAGRDKSVETDCGGGQRKGKENGCDREQSQTDMDCERDNDTEEVIPLNTSSMRRANGFVLDFRLWIGLLLTERKRRLQRIPRIKGKK